MTPILRLLLAAFLAVVAGSCVEAAEVSFNQGWRFHRVDGGGTPERPPAGAAWSIVSLPHTPRLEPRIVNDQWQGTAFYEKILRVPPNWRGKTVLLRVEAAMNVASVRVDGRHVADHLGGYLPFTIDLTPHLRLGDESRIEIRLDNRDNPITGPKPLKDLDFNTYGGLYRGVRLIVKPPVHLTDEMLEDRVAGGGLLVTYPRADRAAAAIRVQADIRNADRKPMATIVRHLLYEGGRLVARGSARLDIPAGSYRRSQQTLDLARPSLWSPRSPALYRLVTLIESASGVDRTETRIGIRRIALDGQTFSINGERMFLRGVNRHQEYPYVGYALSPNADYRDARRIKEAGFDYVRLSHYPHSPAFMAAADELGLLLVDALPGWQFFNPDPRFREQVVRTCRDMIRRDRNHPSVFAWECSLNETDMPKSLVAELHAAVHQELPGDQTWSAGWLNPGYDIYLQARQHRLQHYEKPDRPYIVSEYGDWEYYAQNAGFNQGSWSDLKEEERSSRQPLGAGEARLLQQATNAQEAHDDNLRFPAFADGYWAMFDYNRGYADDLETSGLMSLERLPKYAYWFFASQRDPDERSALYRSGPMVKIASEWIKGSNPVVRIFTNADSVELKLNGRSLGRRKPVRDRISALLAHPPLNFDTGGFRPGRLEAIAYRGGRAVARDAVETPSRPRSLRLALDTADVPPVAGDILFVRATVVDRHVRRVGTPPVVLFSACGDYELIGDRSVAAEAGIASALVRVRHARAKGGISARSAGLEAGRLQENCPTPR